MNGKGSTSSKHRPESFGPFPVRTDFGAGRFGPVYLGRDPSTNARVVIHTFELSREWREFGEQSALLDSFRKLCETTIDHPNLARPLACGAEGDIPYLVYSDLAGTAMDAVMQKDGVRPVAEVLERGRQLADAIDAAASVGVHHGMMAPCDVILDGERTGVTGFGLAQALIRVGIPATAESPYGSPQRIAGAPPTLADDIYSLAAITLELLIGTPRDPAEDTSRALREAQGLPERRRVPRPAPHETRLFTTIAGVDAGKLRAAFAAAFSEEPGERPSTAAEFVAAFEDAFSNRRGSEEPAPRVAPLPFVKERHADVPVDRKEPEPADDEATLDLPFPQEAHEDEPQAPKPESPVARREPIVDDVFFTEVTPPRVRAIDESLYRTPVRSESRAVLIAVVVAVSLATGFGGGFLVGQRSRPSTGSKDVSPDRQVAERQPARAAVEDPKPIASPPPPVVPTPVPPPAEPVVESGPSRAARDTRQQRAKLSERRPARAVDVEPRPTSVPAPGTNVAGSLQVVSHPSGAQVFVDDNPIGTTPLLLSNVAAGSRRVRIEMTGYQIWTTSVRIASSARSRVSASLEP